MFRLDAGARFPALAFGWNSLIATVKGTEAEKVYVTHGQTAVFSKYLNEIGIDAVELKTIFGDEEAGEKEIAEKS